MKELIILFMFACICTRPDSRCEKPGSRITAQQAKTLVLTSLSPQQRALPKVAAQQYLSPKRSPFLFFMVTWEGRSNYSVVVGNYAVDPKTGDVWSATASCDEVSNQPLRQLQKHVRSALHLSQSAYKKIKTNGPLCDD